MAEGMGDDEGLEDGLLSSFDWFVGVGAIVGLAVVG